MPECPMEMIEELTRAGIAQDRAFEIAAAFVAMGAQSAPYRPEMLNAVASVNAARAYANSKTQN